MSNEAEKVAIEEIVQDVIQAKIDEMLVDAHWIGTRLNNLGFYIQVEAVKRSLAALKNDLAEMRKKHAENH